MVCVGVPAAENNQCIAEGYILAKLTTAARKSIRRAVSTSVYIALNGRIRNVQ